jgi:hypothetical protein
MKKVALFFLFVGMSLLSARAGVGDTDTDSITGSISLTEKNLFDGDNDICGSIKHDDCSVGDNCFLFTFSENCFQVKGFFTDWVTSSTRLDYTIVGHDIVLEFVHEDDGSAEMNLYALDVSIADCTKDYYYIRVTGYIGDLVWFSDYTSSSMNLPFLETDSEEVRSFVRQKQPKTDIVTGQKDPKENDDVDVVCRITGLAGGDYQQSVVSTQGNVILLKGTYSSQKRNDDDVVASTPLGRLAAGKYAVHLDVVDTDGIMPMLSADTTFSVDAPSVSDFLPKEAPFEFIVPEWPWVNGDLTDDYIPDATRRDYLFTGLNIEFMVHWDGLPYAGSSLHLDSIVGNKFYLNTPIYSAVDYDMYVNDDLVISLGMLDAGDYEIVLSAVDKADKLHFASYVVPFTVRESPLDVPRGMVYIPTPDKDDYKWREGEPTLSVKTEGDSLHITGWLTYTCCMRHYCYYEIHDDYIYLETVQAGYTWMCDCYDLHYVDFKIGPYRPDDKLTIFTWEYYEGAHIFQFDMTSVSTPETDEPADAERHYDLQGRPAESTRQGILIRNGKKVLVE